MSVFVFCVVRVISFVCFACLLIYLFACACVCVRICVRLRDGRYAGMRSTPSAARPVLRNATDAVQISIKMRILPQTVVERKLVISGSLFLWAEYPQIALSTLDVIFWIDANCVHA